jgi:hypothetical protein
MHCTTDYLLPATYVNLSRKIADIILQIRIWEMCIPKMSTPPPTHFLVIQPVFVVEEKTLRHSNITHVFSICSNNTHAYNSSDTTNYYSGNFSLWV